MQNASKARSFAPFFLSIPLCSRRIQARRGVLARGHCWQRWQHPPGPLCHAGRRGAALPPGARRRRQGVPGQPRGGWGDAPHVQFLPLQLLEQAPLTSCRRFTGPFFFFFFLKMHMPAGTLSEHGWRGGSAARRSRQAPRVCVQPFNPGCCWWWRCCCCVCCALCVLPASYRPVLSVLTLPQPLSMRLCMHRCCCCCCCRHPPAGQRVGGGRGKQPWTGAAALPLAAGGVGLGWGGVGWGLALLGWGWAGLGWAGQG